MKPMTDDEFKKLLEEMREQRKKVSVIDTLNNLMNNVLKILLSLMLFIIIFGGLLWLTLWIIQSLLSLL